MVDSTVNKAGFDNAKALIEQGKAVKDEHGAWTSAHPSAQVEDDSIDQHGYAAFGEWHLGVDPTANPETKGAYSFPFGDFTRVHRSALIAAEERATQRHHTDIAAAARELLALVDGA